MRRDLQQPKGCTHEPTGQSLQKQNDRLQLLLNLTNRITSNLELGEVLRAVSANIRELIQCDTVGFLLYDKELGKFRLLGLDSPHGLTSASVKGNPGGFSGIHGDRVAIQTGNANNFEIAAQYAQRS